MSNLIYLLIAVVLSAAGVLVLWLRTRSSSSPNSSIDEFHHKMRALAPDDDPYDPSDRGTVRRRNRGT
jgi:hypothetical protein